jgi:hypothetical protein
LDVANPRRKLAELNDRSTAEGFWDDPDRAQALLRERASLE